MQYQNVIHFIAVTSSQTVTPSLVSLYPPPAGLTPANPNHYEPHYGASKAIDGNLLTSFRTALPPNGLTLTLGQSMLIRKVRIFTGQVRTVLSLIAGMRI